MEIVNRKAKFDYEFIDTYMAGIVLEGLEIKAIRDGKADISEAFCYFVNNELFLKNASIRYKRGSDILLKTENAVIRKDATRDRKLLLNRNELLKIKNAIEAKGMTVVPWAMFINDRGICKVTIAVARGKKSYDKRETIKKRDTERELRQNF